MAPHPFIVVHVSSEDRDAPASQLTTGRAGWCSQRFPPFPVELVIELRPRANVREIQLVAADHRAPTVIDIFIGDAQREVAGWAGATFALVGSIQFTASSNNTGRLSLPAPLDVSYIKFVFAGAFQDALNPCEQIGLQSLHAVGSPVMSHGSKSRTKARDTEFESEADAVLAEMGILQSVLAQDAALASARKGNLSASLQHDVISTREAGADFSTPQFAATDSIMQLMQQRDKVVDLKIAATDAEDYTEAARLRIIVDWFAAALAAVQTLEERKLAALNEENFEEASKCKSEVDRVMQGALLKSREAGVSNGRQPGSTSDAGHVQNPASHKIKVLIADRMTALERAKVAAVSNEDFGAASQLKGKQEMLHAIEDEVDHLLRELHAALRVEDYHTAKLIGDRLAHLADRISDAEFDPVDSPIRAPAQPPVGLHVPTPMSAGQRREPDPPLEPLAAPALHAASSVTVPEDRPIRPMQASALEQLSLQEQTSNQTSSSPRKTGGEHADEISIISEVFGVEVAEGITAGSWATREKALQTATGLLRTGSVTLQSPAGGTRARKGGHDDRSSDVHRSSSMQLVTKGFSRSCVATAALLRIGLSDKNPQVYFASLRALQLSAEQLSSWDSKALHMWLGAVEMNPSITDHVGDTNARLREASIWALAALSRAKNVGQNYVVKIMLDGQTGAGSSRMCIGQVDTLKQIVSEGASSESPKEGIHLSILEYCGKLFNHPQTQVRTAATELVAQIAVVIGKEATLKILQANLRPVQLAALQKAIDEALAKYPSPASRVHEPGKDNRPQAKQKQSAQQPQQPSKLVSQPSSKVPNKEIIEISDEDDEVEISEVVRRAPGNLAAAPPQTVSSGVPSDTSLENEAGCVVM